MPSSMQSFLKGRPASPSPLPLLLSCLPLTMTLTTFSAFPRSLLNIYFRICPSVVRGKKLNGTREKKKNCGEEGRWLTLSVFTRSCFIFCVLFFQRYFQLLKVFLHRPDIVCSSVSALFRHCRAGKWRIRGPPEALSVSPLFILSVFSLFPCEDQSCMNVPMRTCAN